VVVLTALIVESQKLLQKEPRDLTKPILMHAPTQPANSTAPAYQYIDPDILCYTVTVNALLCESLLCPCRRSGWCNMPRSGSRGSPPLRLIRFLDYRGTLRESELSTITKLISINGFKGGTQPLQQLKEVSACLLDRGIPLNGYNLRYAFSSLSICLLIGQRS
jgi:hypothetical protein